MRYTTVIIFASALLCIFVGGTASLSNQAFAEIYQNNRYGYSIGMRLTGYL
jgi:hypothetical protein